MTLKETIWKSKVYSAASQYLNLCRASHRNTPLNPLSRGEIPPLTPFITNKKSAFQNSPLERGRGCVTPVHSHLKTKTVTEADRYRLAILSPIYRNTSTYAAPFSVTHPFVPSQEGKHPHSNRSLPTRKQHLKTPLSRGAGGV